ncbi:MAG TPA: FkbM family methyltransferase [Rhizomicrobium sp.]|nr:FkbM family methyltransferase [Rhizomicrobium sp.]
MTRMKESLKAIIRKTANALGYDIVGYDSNNPRLRLSRLLARHGINAILDVGANQGHFGWDMRELGYRGRIVSFEPLKDAFAVLERASRADGQWTAANIGLGARDETSIINVAANSQSSSFLPMLDAHSEAAPESVYTTQQPAAIRRLDGVFSDFCRRDDRIFLKIDTQGFEKNVLEGAHRVLDAVRLIQVECSFVPLYRGGHLIEEMIGYLRGLGYDPIEAMPAFYHRDSGHLMQADIIFFRR